MWKVMYFIRRIMLQYFYWRKICKVVQFARMNEIEVSKTDLFHCHVITDTNPTVRDASGNLVMDEDFMLKHYRGLIYDAHEYDGKRSTTRDNFNIFLDDDKSPGSVGKTTPVAIDNPLNMPLPGTIYFRYCSEEARCPPGINRIMCPKLDKPLCVGLRAKWTAGDPALGP